MTRSEMPKLSHLALSALWCVGYNVAATGSQTRSRLSKNFGVSCQGPKFYQLMARLKKAKLITLSKKKVGPTSHRVTAYKTTPAGNDAVSAALDFYAESFLPYFEEERSTT